MRTCCVGVVGQQLLPVVLELLAKGVRLLRSVFAQAPVSVAESCERVRPAFMVLSTRSLSATQGL